MLLIHVPSQPRDTDIELVKVRIAARFVEPPKHYVVAHHFERERACGSPCGIPAFVSLGLKDEVSADECCREHLKSAHHSRKQRARHKASESVF